MSRRFIIAILVFITISPVAFYAILMPVIMLTEESGTRAWGMVAATIGAALISAPLSWFIAPRLRSRFLREHPHRPLD